MNILIFNWRDPKHSWAGGGEIYIFEQAKRWIKLGHSVTVFCGTDHEKKLLPYEKIDGIHIYRKGGRYTVYLWAFWSYISFLKRNKDIVIDVQNGIPFFTPLFCKIPIVTYVYHIHGKQFFYELPKPISHIGYVIEKYIFPMLYKNIPIIAISETTKEELVKINFPKRNIFIVYSGINGLTTIKNKTKKFSNPTILYLGRIKKYKRVDLLVNIFPEILKVIPKARLVIAGWGTEASILVDLVMKSPLRKKITLVGPVSNTEKKLLLSKSWIFVNPSIGEGWSIAVIEANLHGTPAVAFTVPGLTESIQPGKTGMLAKDKKEFIKKISMVLNNHTYREKLSKNATIWANTFSWNRSANESIKIIEKIRRKK